ncbi:putative F-box associated interaction domain-containing protein [Helianthus debilis subsp. tardiflorus]
MTLDEPYSTVTTEAEHLNGLVFFTCVKLDSDDFFVVNHGTREICKIPHPYNDDGEKDLCYLFGFDESRIEHRILMIKKLLKEPTRVQIMTFSLSNYSWRVINAEPPVGISWDGFYYESSVCVNSIVHIMLLSSYDILAFDLGTDKFLIITTPPGVRSHESSWRGGIMLKRNRVPIIEINGCIGVVCHYLQGESTEMHIWILLDYENRVWVKEIITFLVLERIRWL